MRGPLLLLAAAETVEGEVLCFLVELGGDGVELGLVVDV